MAGGTIKLSPEELRSSATKYSQGSSEIDEILNSLTQEQETIRENWEGNAFDSFDNQFSELSPKIREFSELLQDIHEQLRTVAQIIEDTDADIASKIRG